MKRKWNLFQGLTKRQKKVLFGSGAGTLGILFIIIIIYLCSGGKKEQSDPVRRDVLGDAIEATSTSGSEAVEAAGRSLQANIHTPNTSSGSASQEETEVDNELETQTAKVIKNPTPPEPPKKQPDVEPPKPVVNPLQTCEDYQSALAKALKTPNEVADLEALFVKVKELCEGPHQDLTQYVKQQFDARKTEIFASEKPIYNDLTELQATQNHLKQLDTTYRPVKALEQEFCEHFGPKFTTPFGKVESNPDIPEGKDCALEARKHFQAARTFCANYGPMKHPAYEHIVLENYLIAKIKELSNPVHDDIMKYIRILRHLRPNSPYAFTGCDDLAAVQIKLAEGIKEPPKPIVKVKTDLAVPFKDINVSNGPLTIETIKALDDDQLTEIGYDCIDMGMFKTKESFSRLLNLHLLKLAHLSIQIGGNALDWMDSGFNVCQSPQFLSVVRSQHMMKSSALSYLERVIYYAIPYRRYLYKYLNIVGASDEADKCQVEENLLVFLETALKQATPVDLDDLLRLTSIQSIDEVDESVRFFERNKELIGPMRLSFSPSYKNKNKHAALYSLIIEKLDELYAPDSTG